jgi:threonine dehydratase
VQARGAKVVLHGDSYDEAYAQALALGRRSRAVLVHPYDDPEVIAGQGTIGMELLRQQQGRIDAIFVAVGGGGLISGIASYVKRVRPEIRIIGVEPVDSAAMSESLKAGRRVKLASVGLFADGVAVRQVGKETFRICRRLVDEMVQVDTDATAPRSRTRSRTRARSSSPQARFRSRVRRPMSSGTGSAAGHSSRSPVAPT